LKQKWGWANKILNSNVSNSTPFLILPFQREREDLIEKRKAGWGVWETKSKGGKIEILQ